MHKIDVQNYLGKKDLTKFIYKDIHNSTIQYFGNIKKHLELQIFEEEKNPYARNLVFILDKSPRIIKTIIKYKRYDAFIAKLGGFLKILTPIISIIIYFFVSPFYQASKINNMFSIHQNCYSHEDTEKIIKTFLNEKYTSIDREFIKVKNSKESLSNNSNKNKLE